MPGTILKQSPEAVGFGIGSLFVCRYRLAQSTLGHAMPARQNHSLKPASP